MVFFADGFVAPRVGALAGLFTAFLGVAFFATGFLGADFLVVALRDEDENIQTMALRELVKRNIGAAFPYLERMITDKRDNVASG